jgi:hypothetical protein
MAVVSLCGSGDGPCLETGRGRSTSPGGLAWKRAAGLGGRERTLTCTFLDA